MAQVKFKTIVFLTAGFFALLFFHYLPVEPGDVKDAGKRKLGSAVKGIEENKAIARATRQNQPGPGVKHANAGNVFGNPIDTRLYIVQAQTTYMKN